MKIRILLIMVLFLFVGASSAFAENGITYLDKKEVLKMIKGVLEEPEDNVFRCPKSKISDQSMCLNCHTKPSFKLKESPPHEEKSFPSDVAFKDNVAIIKISGSIDSYRLNEFNEGIAYIKWHKEIDTIQIEILSGGGSLMIAWEFIARIETLKSNYKVITIVPGFAASAAFLIWQAGDERLCYEHSILMHHELWTFTMFSFNDVSSAEERARVMRLFQDNIHSYLIKRGALTKEQLDEYIQGEKDYWMTGRDALAVGFATGYVN